MRLPDLSFDYFNRELILEIGVMVGRSIAVDTCIEALLKGVCVRVCIEIDVTKLLIYGVPLGSPDDPNL